MTTAPAPAAEGTAPLQQRRPATLGADLSAAFRFTGGALAAGWRSLLLPGLVYLAILVALWSAAQLLRPTAEELEEQQRQLEIGSQVAFFGPPGSVPLLVLGVVTTVSVLVISLLWTSACYRLGRDLIDGPAGPGSRYFSGGWATVLTIIFYGLACALGALLLIIPGLIATFGLGLAVAAAAAGSAHPFEDSWKLAGRRLGTVIVAILMTSALETLANTHRTDLPAGLLSVLVTPLIALFLTGIFERVSGRELPNLSARTARSAA
ncbi:hypothetical protein Bequi_06330 [Brachybacterium sp. JHP9]|uniref:DUF4013 domain-containing protein n=1 Tax=Brachybacterium equifaecis TaxID=2910770 RepID=A0ABT0R0P1_9MICO|nr:hypothetical protein [Brachybacterium equifaecis]MCL6423008.1 hypothetical protein [Brachybacterium equifaecis]